MNYQKYRRLPEVPLENRQWPTRKLEKAPIWCSVDLRDGNQALEVPMNLHQKVEFFKYLCRIGFKEIEIGFPAASETDFNFTRYLIDNNLIPEDVTIQVLTQSREHIISKTMEALKGAKSAIIHLYNSTSTLQRDVVFGFDRKQCVDLAVSGAKMIKDFLDKDTSETDWILEYSPESFSSTEPDFAVEICDAVLDVWQPTVDHKAIINLPETVEYSTPNVYADQVEYFCTHTRHREATIVSLHTHNDRGTGVASSELGQLAGADRVEGTLFGNGERTGNVDIIVLAINLLMMGVDPVLDFSDVNEAIDVYETCTGMQVGPRSPWTGKLVFTAFSGSHQDAIKKGKTKMKETGSEEWSVPYLPIDPADVGRNYEPIIRINSQSGKGGIAFILEQVYGLILPKSFQSDFLKIIKKVTDENETELLPKQIFDLFDDYYINVKQPYELVNFTESASGKKQSTVEANIIDHGKEVSISGKGNGILDAFVNAFATHTGSNITINNYSEHAKKSGSDSAAITYIELLNREDNKIYLGAGISSSVTKSSVRAIVCAYNRMING